LAFNLLLSYKPLVFVVGLGALCPISLKRVMIFWGSFWGKNA